MKRSSRPPTIDELLHRSRTVRLQQFEETGPGLHACTPCAQRRHSIAAQSFSAKHRGGDLLGGVKICDRNLHPIHAFQNHRSPLST